jgi:hypothetical protein
VGVDAGGVGMEMLSSGHGAASQVKVAVSLVYGDSC